MSQSPQCTLRKRQINKWLEVKIQSYNYPRTQKIHLQHQKKKKVHKRKMWKNNLSLVKAKSYKNPMSQKMHLYHQMKFIQPLKLKQALSKHHSIIEGADHLSTMKTQIKSNTKHTHTFKKYNLIPPNSPIFISLKAKYFFFPCFPNPFIIPELPH